MRASPLLREAMDFLTLSVSCGYCGGRVSGRDEELEEAGVGSDCVILSMARSRIFMTFSSVSGSKTNTLFGCLSITC